MDLTRRRYRIWLCAVVRAVAAFADGDGWLIVPPSPCLEFKSGNRKRLFPSSSVADMGSSVDNRRVSDDVFVDSNSSSPLRGHSSAPSRNIEDETVDI